MAESLIDWTFMDEPVGALYRDLLMYATGVCSAGLLVVRRGLELSAIGQECLEALRPLMIEAEDKESWPGTVLLRDSARVHLFHYSEDCAEILKRFNGRL